MPQLLVLEEVARPADAAGVGEGVDQADPGAGEVDELRAFFSLFLAAVAFRLR
jgi:hypothetical protein